MPLVELEAEVEVFSAGLLKAAPGAVRAAKKLIERIDPLTIEEARPLTSAWIAEIRSAKEGQAGMAAFLNQQKPAWLPEDQS